MMNFEDFYWRSSAADELALDFPEYAEYLKIQHEVDFFIEPTDQLLNEATQATVGNFTAHRHGPHFNGDMYHGHCDLAGGYQVSWNITGPRRHPNKFPAIIPKDAKEAVAKVLRVEASLLEAFWVEDSSHGRQLLFEVAATDETIIEGSGIAAFIRLFEEQAKS